MTGAAPASATPRSERLSTVRGSSTDDRRIKTPASPPSTSGPSGSWTADAPPKTVPASKPVRAAVSAPYHAKRDRSLFPGSSAQYQHVFKDCPEWSWTDLVSKPLLAPLAVDMLFAEDGPLKYLPGARKPDRACVARLLQMIEELSAEQATALVRLAVAEHATPMVLARCIRLLVAQPPSDEVKGAFKALDKRVWKSKDRWSQLWFRQRDKSRLEAAEQSVDMARKGGKLQLSQASLKVFDALFSKRLRRSESLHDRVPSPWTEILTRGDLKQVSDGQWEELIAIPSYAPGKGIWWNLLAGASRTAHLAVDLLFLDGLCRYVPGRVVPKATIMTRLLLQRFDPPLPPVNVVKLVRLVVDEYDDPRVLAALVCFASHCPADSFSTEARMELESGLVKVGSKGEEVDPFTDKLASALLTALDKLRPGFGSSPWRLSPGSVLLWDRFLANAHLCDHRLRLFKFSLELERRTDESSPVHPQDVLLFINVAVLHVARDPIAAVFLLQAYLTLARLPEAEPYQIEDKIAHLLGALSSGRSLWSHMEAPLAGHEWRRVWKRAQYIRFEVKRPLKEMGRPLAAFFKQKLAEGVPPGDNPRAGSLTP